MKIDLDQQLIGLDKTGIVNIIKAEKTECEVCGQEAVEVERETALFSAIIFNCLTSSLPEDQKEGAAALVIRGLLATKIKKGGKVDLALDELKLIKDRTHKVYWKSAELVLSVFTIIDPKPSVELLEVSDDSTE